MKRKGFTLVELAIVLVIIGLLVGGVLAGQELIKRSRLNSIVKDFQDYDSDITIFKNKYNQLPGDFNKGSVFFTDCATNCDGNNDKEIYYSTEGFILWRHLEKAGLIKGGGYTGVIGTLPNHYNLFGENTPYTALENCGFAVYWGSRIIAPFYSGTYADSQNNISFGMNNTSSMTTRPCTSGRETYYIDTKFDDGKPTTGRLTATYSGNTNCYDSGTLEYKMDSDNAACSIMAPITAN